MVASLPGLDDVRDRSVLEALGRAAGPFVRASRSCSARRATDTASARSSGCRASASRREEIPELEAAIDGARDEGIDDLWTWGYEACGHMTRLATPDAPLVWEAVSAALTRRTQKPTEAVRDSELDLRTTREIVGP